MISRTSVQLNIPGTDRFETLLPIYCPAMIAYSFFPKKPAIKYETVNPGQLMLF